VASRDPGGTVTRPVSGLAGSAVPPWACCAAVTMNWVVLLLLTGGAGAENWTLKAMDPFPFTGATPDPATCVAVRFRCQLQRSLLMKPSNIPELSSPYWTPLTLRPNLWVEGELRLLGVGSFEGVVPKDRDRDVLGPTTLRREEHRLAQFAGVAHHERPRVAHEGSEVALLIPGQAITSQAERAAGLGGVSGSCGRLRDQRRMAEQKRERSRRHQPFPTSPKATGFRYHDAFSSQGNLRCIKAEPNWGWARSPEELHRRRPLHPQHLLPL